MNFTLKNKSDISGTHWIEFNISGTTNSYKHWAEDSRYLEEFAYNFYTDIFEKNSDIFDYYGNTRFKQEELLRIKQDVEYRIRVLQELKTFQELIHFGDKTSNALNLSQDIQKMYDKYDGQITPLVNDIKRLGHNLSDLFENCINNKKTLWLLGL